MIPTHNPRAELSPPAQERTVELARDMQAAAVSSTTRPLDIDALHMRPSILRRLAALIAEHLPAGLDRVIARTPDTALVTAVALHSGLPSAVLEAAKAQCAVTVRGDLHPAEKVVLVATSSEHHDPHIAEEVRARGAELVGLLTAVEADSRSCVPGVTTQALFCLRDHQLCPKEEHP